jgi:N-acylneuraminate cytidylyltransferase
MNVIALIPARRGPQNKCLWKCAGKTLIEWAVESAREAKLVTHICLTTDIDPLPMKRSRDLGIIVRPPALATDDARMDHVIRHAAQVLMQSGYKPDIIALVAGNVPVRTKGCIDNCIRLIRGTNADCALTVSPARDNPMWMLNLNDGRAEWANPGMRPANRQQLPPAYFHDGACIAFRGTAALRDGGDNPFAYRGSDWRAVISHSESVVEVHDRSDLAAAEYLLGGKRK